MLLTVLQGLGAPTQFSSMPLGLPSLCRESKRSKPLRGGSQSKWQVPSQNLSCY